MLPIGSQEAECSMCQAKAKKKISAPAIHFSGSGFYASDNRKQNTNTTKPESTKESIKEAPVKKDANAKQ